MIDVIIWAIDIGSVSKNRLGWHRIHDSDARSGQDIRDAANYVAADLSRHLRVAIGFECPLFVPVPDDPFLLTSARQGEGSRSWSAGAGSGALATGLTECVWVLEQIRRMSTVTVEPTFRWEEFSLGQANVFIWEAFVTATAKGTSHQGDAEIAARTFLAKYPHINEATAVTAQNPYSLIGAALLRAGLSTDLSLLSEQCIVIKS